MVIATKNDILALCGPEPLSETLRLPGTDFEVSLRGIVRSVSRAAVYREIDNMARLTEIPVDGRNIQITEGDIIAACWAEACVVAPKLTSLEWLAVGAKDTDLLNLIGSRCLICSRLMPSDVVPDGVEAARQELDSSRDPFPPKSSDSAPSSLEDCLVN